MVGLDDSMVFEAILLSHIRGLVDQRGSITKEDCSLPLLHGFVADAHAEVGLTSTRRCHDHLVLVAILKPLAKCFMGLSLEGSWWWEGCSIITLTWS